MRRAVITGIGAVTPVGHGANGLWAGVLANQSAVKAIDRFDAGPFPSRIAAQIDDFVPGDHLDARRARRLDRFSQLTVAAARMAPPLASSSLPSSAGSGASKDWKSQSASSTALSSVCFAAQRDTSGRMYAPRSMSTRLAFSRLKPFVETS